MAPPARHPRHPSLQLPARSDDELLNRPLTPDNNRDPFQPLPAADAPSELLMAGIALEGFAGHRRHVSDHDGF